MKILLADDDNAMRLYFTKFLEKKGFEVTACANGEEAWNELQKTDYPLVLLDWNMPFISGAVLCERIKQERKNSYTYVILITSRSDVSDVVEGLRSGADDYIKKPVIAAELEARIRSALRVIEFEEKLAEKESQVRLTCYRAITQLAETRDNESENHMSRVGEICGLIAEQMGLSEQFCKDLRIFAPMHDIGKVGIPDGILHAPRNLLFEEYQVIKMHTQFGWEILIDKEPFEFAAKIAFTHHEHFDGTGYPRNLKGNNIPLEGRICAVADCYDSLRSTKAYRGRANHELAIEWIEKNSGTLFDPDVVNAILGVQDKLQAQFDESYSSLLAKSTIDYYQKVNV